MSKEKLIITLTVLVDVIGFGIVIPVLPFYVQSFGASPLTITLLFAVFSFFAFLSAPFLGSLSDRIGRKPILIISILSTAVGWLVFASAHSILFLFIGRILDGLAAGNFSTAQSALVDIAKNEKERTANLGVIGAVFGIGFIIGPMCGGLLSSISTTTPFWFVGCLALVNAIVAIFFLPETNKQKHKEKKISFNPVSPLIRAATNKPLLPFFAIWLLFMIAIASQQSVFALYLEKAFGYGAFVSGAIMTATGLFLALNQGFAMKHFWLKYFQEKNLTFWMIGLLIPGFLLMSWNWLLPFYIGLAILTLGQSLLRTLLTSQIAASAGVHERGEVLGILSSLMSVGMIIGPIVAGSVFEIHPVVPFFIAAGCSLICFFIFWCVRKRIKKELKEPIALQGL